MTVAELKKILENYSDDTEVGFCYDGIHPAASVSVMLWNGVGASEGGDECVTVESATQEQMNSLKKTLVFWDG